MAAPIAVLVAGTAPISLAVGKGLKAQLTHAAPDYASDPHGALINMVPRFSRFLPFLIFLLLTTPLVAGLTMAENEQEVLKEGRIRTPAPSIPHSVGEWAALPKKADEYLHDRFGLRKQMIRGYAYLTKTLLAEGNHLVLVGRHDQMFYMGEENSVRQSAGLLLRASRVAESADFLADLRDALRQRGMRLVVASPPNAATIYQDKLPRWARSNGRPTEYDLFMTDLTALRMEVELRRGCRRRRSRQQAWFLQPHGEAILAALAAFDDGEDRAWRHVGPAGPHWKWRRAA